MSRLPIAAAIGDFRLGLLRLGRVPLEAWAVLAAIAIGYEVAHGRTSIVIAVLGGLTLLAAVTLWPEAVLIAWFAAILANGRWLTYHSVGPLYVTEPLLAALGLGLSIRLLSGHRRSTRFAPSPQALRFLGAVIAVMWLPGLIGLLVETDVLNYAASRNFVLVLYSVFALIAGSLTRLTATYRWWFIAVIIGSTIALMLVITGHSGPEEETSTGAIRIASHTFALAFGIAPIVLIAAARERLVPLVVAACGTAAFLVALVFVNHRSTWIAFAAAAVILFGRRLTPAVVTGGFAVLVVGGFLFSAPPTSPTTFSQEITRAKSVADTDDPNARFRLSFWKHALSRSVDSPLIGSGFDPYPPDLVPPKSTKKDDPFLGPHNSFVALGYRLGLVPLLVLLFLLGSLLKRGFSASVHGASRHYRATCAGLTAIVVYLGVTSAFNVFLEAPYAGPLFWTAVGLLAGAVYAPKTIESDASYPEADAGAQRRKPI